MTDLERGSGVLTAIGLMSGTSMDGIDVALIRSDGVAIAERGPFLTVPYSPAFRRRLADGLETAKEIVRRDERPGALADLEAELTALHAEAVASYSLQFDIAMDSIDLVGFHGQTVLHRPERGLTVQIGDGEVLAAELKTPVVCDMRAADMESGGEGAPLAPAYHGALAASIDRPGPVAFVNIGGISNVTLVGGDGTLHAFDTGPGNALIDQWVETKAGIPFDQGGAIASEGQVLRRLVEPYLQNEFFNDGSRRSLDRNDFLPPDPAAATLEDGARSLARLTAEAILKSVKPLKEAPKTWIVCGGGRCNRMIMSDLSDLVAPDGGTVLIAEEIGLNGDAIEAEAWAYLAIRSHYGLALSWPTTTGCRKPVTGGITALPGQKRATSR
ncbi:anhydro-N-acetylmuramic acid kinase [Nitratireductor sp. XY-223]|uniref:anhydro-N-acetylmuramic acid kinase n=1 Tax=Nitratireductor sp. XY-223 TaxID=2561926 RepID=UPI0010AAA2CE|nr:anhydro-N-acetylmuramic acid kinase [Nitratireductor sp. XY-223]